MALVSHLRRHREQTPNLRAFFKPFHD